MLLDAALPFEFGFRDVKIVGRDLLLNGVPIHLRALYNRSINASANVACKASALELCRRLKSEGFNFIIAGNYNFSPGAVSYMDALLEACDESGVLFSFSLPHVRDYNFQLDKPDVAARYRELTRWAIRRARNHPSVVSYAMNHNCAGYTGDMKRFMEMNPGLQSRFSRTIEFPDYSNQELAAIFRQMVKKNKYVLSKEFDENLVGAMAFWTKKRDRHFGNGRFVRNKFEKAVENQSLRLSSIDHPTKEQLVTLELTDVGLVIKPKKTEKPAAGKN
jgi:hypothetical protein